MVNETHPTTATPEPGATPVAGDGAARGSWQEREIATALQRLATARANLAALEEGRASAGPLGEVDDATRTRLAALDAQIADLVPQSSGRKGRHARAQIDELTRDLGGQAAAVGLGDADGYRAARATFDAVGGGVDPTVLAFTLREAEAAEVAFLEITSLVLPDPEPDPELAATAAEPVEQPDGSGTSADEADAGELFGMRLHPPAAS